MRKGDNGNMTFNKKVIYCSKNDDGLIQDNVDDDLMIYDSINGNVYVLNKTVKII